mmetsp:Transcript_144268/g.350263  ORF Transcript_144268/g.350263 Transcript_144268/m.350263 type:complete len:432 (+) Transcript_144268:3-1298(+)
MTPTQYQAMRARRDAAAAAKPDLTPRHQPIEEAEPPWVRASLEANGVRAVRPEVVKASEVPKAIYEGRVVQFDATEILPREVFNMTIPQIAAMHGDLADEIPIYKQNGASQLFGWSSLRDVGRRIELLGKADKLYHPNSVPVPRDPRALRRGQSDGNASTRIHGDTTMKTFDFNMSKALQKLADVLPSSREALGLDDLLVELAQGAKMSPQALEGMLHDMRVKLSQYTINVRRLPKIPQINLKEALGNPEWLERSWSMFWTGAMGIWWHNDEPDNLLIAINKEMTVAVFEMNDTDLLSGSRGPIGEMEKYYDLAGFHPDRVDQQWLEKNQWIKKFPYIRVHLKPGMGVTVPSRTYHAIWAQDSDRILLNAFLLPKHGALEQAPRPNNGFYGPGIQSELYMALWHLKMSSLGRLWDSRHLGGFFEMTKLEIF